MTDKFDYYKAAKVDYSFNFALVIIIVPWLIYSYNLYFVSNSDVYLDLYLAPIFSLLGLIYSIKRLLFFQNLFNEGVDVKGYIDSAKAFKTGGARIEYKYEYKGENYWTGNALVYSAYRKHGFHEGDEVMLRINPDHPKRAIIKDIYF